MILTVRARATGAEDAHGNAAETWTERDWQVHAIAPGAFTEAGELNRDRLDVAWTVYADMTTDVPTAADRVDVKGETFEVYGEPQDWTHGPWQHPTAGVVIELKRTEG